ncbi:MAG: M48 family metallopeptidase, partial [Rhodobacteraceae bacterium]|nr:M48 family metallopeptidase [Paracoccaceae bacterium]
LQHVDDDLARLIVPHGHAEDVIREISGNLGKRRVQKGMIRKLVFWVGGAVASVALIMFVILPSMADQLAKMIPPEREAALGRTALRQIERYMLGSENSLGCTSPKGLHALQKMTTRLTVQADIPYDLNVQVFNHPMVNAFAVPGGNVVLFEGLLKAADTPEEVAGVLAHEIGHVVHRDPTRLTLRSAGSVGILGMVFGDFAGGFFALVLAEQLISASYAQDAEAGADAYAHDALAAAGLPSQPFAGFFLKLKDKYGDSDGLMSHLASHPDLVGRAAAAEAADAVGEGGFEAVLTEAEWADLKGVCG